ncbi:CobW domain-containing protein [Seminavis robusta]|uniref:CobW domain-containing protein n=1 Tax=Seminavis robusta TaxID=568900 RepID=A0A9N8EMV4_9STRA|nr:CobW domain-containing protein [Seminavis robusta]|eukprot:Sro1486_g276610.1 CobW domain-containing protein (636) ;mRNA; r:5900-7807
MIMGVVLPFLALLSCTDAFVPRAPWSPIRTSIDATVAEDVADLDQESITKKTPIILLAGFLGTGKTTTLKHLLENTEGSRIGVIVNDVASVNIDAKLVSSMPESASEDMIELQNGCACCSLSDELFTSVETLFQPKRSGILRRKKAREYDAIVVELSGVADPQAVRATWTAAAGSDRFPATEMAEISKIVTMIDSCTFATDYMTWDAVAQRPGWAEPGDDCAGNRKVAELLAEQVEAANLILVNKIDMATEEEVEVSSKVARALNEKATLHNVAFGKISPSEILELGTTDLLVDFKEEKDEAAAETSGHSHGHDHACEEPGCTDESHDHSHDSHACEEPGCTDESHDHSHDSHSHDHACEDPGCTDESHDHSHNHDHACEEPGCTDESHDHSHESGDACIDPGCTDTSHSHSHSHSTSTDNLGIVNFVYKSARPFNTNRLMAMLNTWPIPVKDVLDLKVLEDAQSEGYDMGDGLIKQDSPFVGVLRSKGFCWLAPTKWSGANWDAYRHDTAMYWSHAGKHFGLSSNGKWWGSIQMYDKWEEYMKKLFKDNMAEYERIMREDFVSEEFGDRRQELVFIGMNLDQAEITKTLDDCLLSDEELETYRQNLRNYQDVLLSESGGKGLFDTDGSVTHTEA